MNDTAQSKTNYDQPKKITAILADDHPLLRTALRDQLESQPDFEVVAEAQNGEEAIRFAAELDPDLVIMDISMAPINGIEATKIIKEKSPSTAVLVLTVYDETPHILGILQAGANGYLTKGSSGDDVVQAARAIVNGETVLSPEIFNRIMKLAARHVMEPISVTAGETITKREQEILRLAARGLSNVEIAQILELSKNTVKSYLVEIYAKLHVNNRTGALLTALQAGLFSIDDVN